MNYKNFNKDEWDEKKEYYMTILTTLKIEQHEDIRTTLINTHLRKLICSDKNNGYWGYGINETGENRLGKIFMTIRNKIISQLNNDI